MYGLFMKLPAASNLTFSGQRYHSRKKSIAQLEAWLILDGLARLPPSVNLTDVVINRRSIRALRYCLVVLEPAYSIHKATWCSNCICTFLYLNACSTHFSFLYLCITFMHCVTCTLIFLSNTAHEMLFELFLRAVSFGIFITAITQRESFCTFNHWKYTIFCLLGSSLSVRIFSFTLT